MRTFAAGHSRTMSVVISLLSKDKLKAFRLSDKTCGLPVSFSS